MLADDMQELCHPRRDLFTRRLLTTFARACQHLSGPPCAVGGVGGYL